jgi:Zn-dependent protease
LPWGAPIVFRGEERLQRSVPAGSFEPRPSAASAREGPAPERYNGRPRSPVRTRGRSTAIDILCLALLDQEKLVPTAVVIALLVISLGIHEAAHAWVALQCGDTTARDLGRITLNPIAHIDPFMTIILPTMMFISTGHTFGGAKPVPVNYYNLRNPLRDMALVAIAGPASNFLLAVFFFLLEKLVVQLGIWGPENIGIWILSETVSLNLLLAAFNLLPIPPLDGSRVMTWLLPGGLREGYAALERFGLLLVILAIYFVPPVNQFVGTTIRVLGGWVESIVSLGGAW